MRTPTRILLTAAVVAAFQLLAAPAQASTCPLLVDVAGDGVVSLAPGLVSSPDLDIRSADVASGPTTVVAVLRVASADANVVTAQSTEWTVAWRIGGNNYAASLRRGFGTFHAAFESAAASTPVTASYDTAGTITWTIPRSLLPDLATAGATFTQIRAVTSTWGTSADAALTTQTYVDQSPGCVPAS